MIRDTSDRGETVTNYFEIGPFGLIETEETVGIHGQSQFLCKLHGYAWSVDENGRDGGCIECNEVLAEEMS